MSAAAFGIVAYDTTHGVTLTPDDMNIPKDGVYYMNVSTWGVMGVTGDTEIEVRAGSQATLGDTLGVGTITLELR